MDERIRNIMRAAYLCAVGDAFLAAEEVEALNEIEPFLRLAVRNEEILRECEPEGELPVDEMDLALVTKYETSSFFGGLPEHLAELHEDRSAVRSIDELDELHRSEAARIVEDFDRELALVSMMFVGSADGEMSEEELSVVELFEDELWGLGGDGSAVRDTIVALMDHVFSQPGDEEAQEYEDSVDAFPDGALENGPGVIVGSVVVCAAADGALDPVQREAIGVLAHNLIDFMGQRLSGEDLQVLADDVNDAMDGVLGALFSEGDEPRGSHLAVLKQCASYISSPIIAALASVLAREFIAKTGGGVLEQASCLALQAETAADEGEMEQHLELAMSLLEIGE